MPGLKVAQMNTMRVISVESDGYQLENDDGAIFLNQSLAKHPLHEDDTVDAFLYFDQSKSVVATTYVPTITAYDCAWVEVVEQKFGLGVFVNIGLKKDMLLSKDDLPHLKEEWPQKGDLVFAHLKPGKSQMVAKIPARFQLSKTLEPQGELEVGLTVQAYVFNLGPEGLVCFTQDGFEIYVYYKHTRKQHRIGEALEITITHMVSRLKYNGTLTPQKELALESDADRILDVLKKQGSIPYGDKSNADAIFKEFHMSKAAFKRALGTLYKERKVRLAPHQTTLREEE